MLKYKQKINEHLDNTRDQLEKLVTWIEYNRVTPQHQVKLLNECVEKLNHCSDLIDLEQG